jgi:valyl-tRNA synthetase
MSIPATYDYRKSEEKWYQYWLDQKVFSSTPDERKAYTIVIPPPNVTGVLHMGHMLNNTLQDVLIRRARMKGFNACWVPGTDHASIATEAKVVAKLKEEGIEKSNLTREEFLEHAWEWTHKHGGIILEQLKKLGASCDWDRTSFTMDEIRSESVIKVFVDLYNKGKIYRGYRMVNWDPDAQTTVSDEEVIHKDVSSKLYYLKYAIEGEEGEFVTVATTRPETILGDVAVCINPDDERYKHLKGKRVIVPIANRSIPIIEDEYVDIEFGTGCLKITPAHDINDKAIGDKHNLEIIDVLNADGTLNKHGLHYEGLDRFVARKKIGKELEEKQYLSKIEDYQTSVGTSERTGAVIEPRLSVQWFLKMKDISEPALKAVMEDKVKLIPAKFKNTYRHWMENVHDWCISRQLLWGHQIPAWYYGQGMEDFVVADTLDDALVKAIDKTGNNALTKEDLKQDEDALDTWFSSWLWPISVFDGIRNPENEEINYYYPTQDLVTAPEILFFWVARMVIAGLEYRDVKPFTNVYLTGIVRDKQGRKMSKSLGNSPDPIELMEKYSTDGVRVGMLLTSPAGNDLPFDEDLCAQGSKFINKIWNAYRLVEGWEIADGESSPAAASAIVWFEEKFKASLEDIEKSFEQYRLSEALMTIYKFVWDDFCGAYLEAVKPDYGKPIESATRIKTLEFFERITKLFHPFMPFLSEELWQIIGDRKDGETICTATWEETQPFDSGIIKNFDQVQNIISGVRNIRASKNIAKKDALDLVAPSSDSFPKEFEALIIKLANLSSLTIGEEKSGPGFSFLAGPHEFFIPAGEEVDLEEEKVKIEKDLKYYQGFLISVGKKLSNERFVSGAPAQVVDAERKKQADAEAKIKALEQRLAELN